MFWVDRNLDRNTMITVDPNSDAYLSVLCITSSDQNKQACYRGTQLDKLWVIYTHNRSVTGIPVSLLEGRLVGLFSLRWNFHLSQNWKVEGQWVMCSSLVFCVSSVVLFPCATCSCMIFSFVSSISTLFVLSETTPSSTGLFVDTSVESFSGGWDSCATVTKVGSWTLLMSRPNSRNQSTGVGRLLDM